MVVQGEGRITCWVLNNSCSESAFLPVTGKAYSCSSTRVEVAPGVSVNPVVPEDSDTFTDGGSAPGLPCSTLFVLHLPHSPHSLSADFSWQGRDWPAGLARSPSAGFAPCSRHRGPYFELGLGLPDVAPLSPTLSPAEACFLVYGQVHTCTSSKWLWPRGWWA